MLFKRIRRKKAGPKAGFFTLRQITWLEQVQQQELQRQQQERRQEQQRQQLEQALQLVLEQLQRLVLEQQQQLLLFCCKQPKQQPTGR